MGNHPFSGIRVLELAEGIAAPYCGMQLAALGADVLKVEVGDGDYLREWTFPGSTQAPLHESLNRNKQVLTLPAGDDGPPGGVRRLAEEADVVLASWTDDLASRHDVGHESLRRDNPRLVYGSFSDFGERPGGAYEGKRQGSELVIQAMTGAWGYVGRPENPPIRVGADLASTWAGINGFQAVVAALIERERSGEGQLVEVSLLRSLMATYLVRHGMESPSIDPAHWLSRCEEPDVLWEPYPLWQTADLPVCLDFFSRGFSPDESRWREFFAELGIPDIVEDERFGDVMIRRKNWRELRPIFEDVLAKYTAAEIRDIVLRIGGVATPANTIESMCDDPQVVAMEMVRELERSGQAPLRYMALPWEFNELEPVPALQARQVDIARLGEPQAVWGDTADG